MTIDQIHTYIGYAYTIGTALVAVLTVLGKVFPSGPLGAWASNLGTFVADVSKLGDRPKPPMGGAP